MQIPLSPEDVAKARGGDDTRAWSGDGDRGRGGDDIRVWVGNGVYLIAAEERAHMREHFINWFDVKNCSNVRAGQREEMPVIAICEYSARGPDQRVNKTSCVDDRMYIHGCVLSTHHHDRHNNFTKRFHQLALPLHIDDDER